MKLIEFSPMALAVLGILVVAGYAQAEIITKTIDYKHGDTELQGYLAYDDSQEGKRPGVLVVHEWWGLTDHPKQRARELAEAGYVAFALDMYGKGKVTTEASQASQWAGELRNASDPSLMRERAKAGLEVLASQENVDARNLAAIGFCFGGTTVLQLAYSGAPVKGVVSFHGGLQPARPGDYPGIESKFLILHGAADPHVSEESIEETTASLDSAEADWQMIYYSGAVHSFTNPGAGSDPSRGSAYDERTARRAFAHMHLFFDELFGSM